MPIFKFPSFLIFPQTRQGMSVYERWHNIEWNSIALR